MKWKAVIIAVCLLLVGLVLTAAITAAIEVALEEANSGPVLDNIISDNSIFPDGSYTISVSDLIQDSPDLGPLPVDIPMLNELGLRIDSSSMVAETNRLNYFYIRLPHVDNVKSRDKRDASDHDSRSIGIQFGNSETIHAVPLHLKDIPNSGLSYAGSLPDKSHVYQVQARMPSSMCSGSSAGSCSSVNWTPYAFSSANIGTRASFDNQVHVACGSQCDADASSPCAASCDTCDGKQVAGADTPVTRRYKMCSSEMSKLPFYYDTFVAKDRITISYEGKTIFDSGCVGTRGEKRELLEYSGKSLEVRVDVEPNCAGTTGTEWNFQLSCGGLNKNDKCSEYKCLESKAQCGPNGYLINYGLYYCNRYFHYYDRFTPEGQKFIDCTRNKLLDYMDDYLSTVNGPADCTDLQNRAFASHVPAYTQCGFCKVFCDNKAAFGKVLYKAAFIWNTYSGGCETLIQCLNEEYPNGIPPLCVTFLGNLCDYTPVIG